MEWLWFVLEFFPLFHLGGDTQKHVWALIALVFLVVLGLRNKFV